MDQQRVLTAHRSAICLHDIWDPKTATIAQCFLPVIVLLPALVGALILLGQALRFLFPKRPRWMRPFVEEIAQPVVEVDLVARRRWTGYTRAVLALSTTGLALQLAACIVEHARLVMFMSILPWIIAISEIVVLRPRTVPYAVLWLLVTESVAQVITIVNDIWWTSTARSLGVASTAFGGAAVLVLLFMPLRDPFWPTKDVSKPFTEPTSALRSPEDDLNLFQFMTVSWVSPLLTVARGRQLEDTDVWTLPYAFLHQRLHENCRQLRGTVITRLLIANAIDIFITTGLGLLGLVTKFSGPVLLQLILSSMMDTNVPRRVPIMYSFIVLAARLVQSQVGVFQLWFGRRCYERSRGEMITMLHEKTLARKIAFQVPGGKKEASTNGHANGTNGHAQPPAKDDTTTKSWWSRVTRVFRREKALASAKETASMGKILNLMRNDVYEVAQRFWEIDKLVQVPLSVALSMTLAVRYMGPSSLLAVAVVVSGQLLSAGLARVKIIIEKRRRGATDKKLQIISQFVEALRHLRWYGWQNAWLEQVFDARQRELNLRLQSSFINLLIALVNTLSLDLTPTVAFFAYTVIAKQRLTVDIAFTAYQLFGMMTFALNELPNLITTIINAWVAVTRIEEFMAEPDREENSVEALVGDELSVYNASFAWPGAEKPVLHRINLSFPEGLTVITGEVASGKTALLQALLGELDMLDGQLLRPAQPIGYCAQTPWLQSMSIRDNILFSSPFSEERYNAVLEACALLPDLAELRGRDHAMIGENGIGLSGGQKARVALARAVYSQAKILFLDDPLSALDQQTAEFIVRKLFDGPLMKKRTVILVTHRKDLVVSSAKQFVTMHGGIATITDEETAVAATVEEDPHPEAEDEHTPADDAKNAAVANKFLDDEHREEGSVKLAVFWTYIKAGNLKLWGVLIVCLIIFRVLIFSEGWFVKSWGEAYKPEAMHAFASLSPDSIFVASSDSVSTLDWISDRLPPPEENVMPWLWVIFWLAFGQSIAYTSAQIIITFIVYIAAKNMFHDIMVRVANATFRFYDVTPVGRLMNRMTSDIGVIDGGISMQFMSISWLGITFIASIVVIAALTPAFLVFSIVAGVLFVLIFRNFITASQSLRRLETTSLSPLMSNFGALLHGLATVRAFRAQERFQNRVIQVVDTFQKMDHFYWSAQSWITYRYDVMGAFTNFFLFLLALVTNQTPGLTAMALLSAGRFVSSLHQLCKEYGQLQLEFVSVERVVELIHLDQEPAGTVAPPAWWPSFTGDIVFENVTIRYAPHLPPALENISLTIKAGSKTAIIGRTGSGKSTFAISLLATILPSEGRITIDGVDLAEVDKQLLRTRITFLAQDPVLFSGTLRKNLDPLEAYTDEECKAVLTRVCERQGWKLDTKVEEGGKNLSQGQRQLVGLARAVLRKSALVILDEATASIDKETAEQIQRVMLEEMSQSTVITIAHRVEAVHGVERFVVLGKGRLLKEGAVDEGVVATELADVTEE